MLSFDVVIAGGGTVGSSLALGLLKSTQLSVAIIEAQPFVPGLPHPGFDARAVALGKGSCEFLAGLGLDANSLNSTFSQQAAAIAHIHVSDKGHMGQCQLHHQDYQLDYLGQVIELHTLGELLQQQLQPFVAAKQLHYFCPDKITQLTRQQDQVQLALQSGKSLSAKLLVVAEGGDSSTKSLLKVKQSEQPYEQMALIANVALNQPHQHWAYERFTECGPVALLPLPPLPDTPHRCSLVWSIKPSQQQQWLEMPDRQFLQQLQQVFGYRLGIFTQVGARDCYPLRLLQVENPVSHRSLVMGNASQSLHPIAGQGLNLGLRDVAELLRCIGAAVRQHTDADIGAAAVLRAYQHKRKPDQQRVIGLTDSLVRLFSNDHLVLAAARNLGLTALNGLPWLKRQLAMQAMGYNNK